MEAVSEVMSRICARPGVQGAVCASLDPLGALVEHVGVPLEDARQYALQMASLADHIQAVTLKELQIGEPMGFFTLRTKSHDILVSRSKQFLFITLRDPTSSAAEQK